MNNDLKRSRPLSPHLSDYGWTITSLMSISHRITGVILFSGLLLVVLWVYLLATFGGDGGLYLQFSDLMKSTLGQIAISGYIFCLFFNLGCNIRHVFWDFGKGFELKDVYRSAWLIIYLSVILTGVSLFIIKVSNF